MRRHLVAVDIGGSKIAVLAREVNSGRIVHADKIKTPASEGIRAILRLIDEQMDNVPGGRASVVALGVAVPGHVDHRGHVHRAGNLIGWFDVPLRAVLEARYRIPVFVERDANCAALGEKWCGAAKRMNDFVFLALGTGVGAGLFLNGGIYRGAHFAAGEAGDMSFPSNEPGKDARTVSEVVGKRAIKKKVKEATGEKMSAAEALVQAKSERRLERATRDVVEYLGTSVVAISSLLDPEAILFGGGTSNAGKALLERVRQRAAPDLVVHPRLLLAGLGSESQLYGALWGAAGLLERDECQAVRAVGGRRRESRRSASSSGGRLRTAPPRRGSQEKRSARAMRRARRSGN
jgi:predicted NBD/HSP70 family sugar kinase